MEITDALPPGDSRDEPDLTSSDRTCASAASRPPDQGSSNGINIEFVRELKLVAGHGPSDRGNGTWLTHGFTIVDLSWPGEQKRDKGIRGVWLAGRLSHVNKLAVGRQGEDSSSGWKEGIRPSLFFELVV